MLILPAVITTREARDTQRMLAQALRNEAKAGADVHVTVDASGLSRFDSSALAVLLECQRLAQAWGKGLVVRDAPPKLADLAKLYGVDALLLPSEGAGTAGAPVTPADTH